MLELLGQLGSDLDAEIMAPFATDQVPVSLCFNAVVGLGHLRGPLTERILLGLVGQPLPDHVRDELKLALLHQVSFPCIEALIDLVPERELDPRTWFQISLLANREFESGPEVLDWSRNNPHLSLQEKQVQGFELSGYDVGGLKAKQELEELLRAALDPSEILRRNAWRLFVDTTGHDSSDGKFWVIVKRQGKLVTESRHAMGAQLDPETERQLRDQQAAHVEAARAWLLTAR